MLHELLSTTTTSDPDDDLCLLTGEALALWMVTEMQERMATQARPLIVSVAGAQGSGKSTLSKQVAEELEVNGQPRTGA